MGFKLNEFSKAKFEPRTELVSVPALSDFFDDGETPQFKVRGLTGEEMARVNESLTRHKNVGAIIEALAGKDQLAKVQKLRETMGIDYETMPEDLARRIEMLHLGCVEPTLDIQTASKLFRVAPVDAFAVSNKVLQLSGLGMLPGEQKASGKEATSKPHATSDTPGA